MIANILHRSWAGMALCAAMVWPAFAGPCESVLAVNLAHAKITSAEVVQAGAFRPPQGGGSAAAFQDLAAFCRVAATLSPSADSQIGIEVWMPVSGWNGKLEAVGNGRGPGL